MTDHKQQDQWAIVELFGHARIAGRISEQTIGGQSFVRVDVPEIEYTKRVYGGEDEQRKIAAHTRSFGGSAIYSINWCDEHAARLAAQSIKHQPIDVFSLRDALRSMGDADRQRLLAAPVRDLVGGGDHGDDQPY